MRNSLCGNWRAEELHHRGMVRRTGVLDSVMLEYIEANSRTLK